MYVHIQKSIKSSYRRFNLEYIDVGLSTLIVFKLKNLYYSEHN